jgi:hypothetical protein
MPFKVHIMRAPSEGLERLVLANLEEGNESFSLFKI